MAGTSFAEGFLRSANPGGVGATSCDLRTVRCLDACRRGRCPRPASWLWDRVQHGGRRFRLRYQSAVRGRQMPGGAVGQDRGRGRQDVCQRCHQLEPHVAVDPHQYRSRTRHLRQMPFAGLRVAHPVSVRHVSSSGGPAQGLLRGLGRLKSRTMGASLRREALLCTRLPAYFGWSVSGGCG